VPLKVTAMAAFMLVLPYVLYQAWAFVAPGLYEHEKKLALPIVVGSTALFFLGVAFCYYLVFGRVFTFINEFAPKSITPAPDIEAYLSFVITMFLAFGIAFEIPIVVIVLVRAGVVSVQKLGEIRPYVILGSAVAAAIVTPPDVVSMLALLIPMCLLYELGILLARLINVRAKTEESVPSVQKPLN
jgi:sec-independent protein translocase protein TatC